MHTNIWAPLGMDSTTFRPWTRPDLTEKLVELAWRNPDGTLAKGKVPFGYLAADCCAGVGLYSTPEDQAKLLSALLGGGADIISKESMDELLRPQTADPSHFLSEVCGSKRGHLGQTWPEGSKGDFGLSSSINADNFPGRRAAGSANWQGMPGVHAVSHQPRSLPPRQKPRTVSAGVLALFPVVSHHLPLTLLLTIAQWLDRTTGLAGLFMTQVFCPLVTSWLPTVSVH